MKNMNAKSVGLIVWLASLSSLCSVHAQNYTIDWFTIDCGGGASTGGVYSVTDTIGQPDAGGLIGGNFTLAGGFWGILAPAIQSAVALTIQKSGTNITLSWPGGRTLQSADAVTGPYVDVSGATSPYAIASTAAKKFYRLRL
jgi:hypothetical protein